MSNSSYLNTAFMRPVFSPRSQMSRYLNDIQKNKTSLIINIDKETLLLFKNEFQAYDNKMNKPTFVAAGLKILKSWQKDMPYRQSRMITYLNSLFEEIQDKVEGNFITWQQFNNLIIQKALNLKSLQSHDSETVSQLKHVNWSKGKLKLNTPIQKIVCINKQKKLAFFCQQSNKIQFLSMYGNQHNFKPLVLDRQELLVQKTLTKRVKNQSSGAVIKQNYKKQVIVSGYSVTFLEMIYVSSQKYEMLITSSTDGLIRGWDVHGNTPTLAKQPQNQQQKMIHQFPAQIHSMAWDQINDILYCSPKNSKIYLWIVKTDSQKELWDPQGHHSMISSMIMMPKLQFLATGDYDGKLILWDTISMNKKYKYQQHTRSIVSMTFHQSLILLFTASFDHSICVWNPYIPSLIYKISCNINAIHIQIISGTNYLAALDAASNLKIRQINKFNLISNFVVDRPEDNDNQLQQNPNQGFMKIQPVCMGISDGPIRFFFGGHSIKCMQFDENQALSSSQYCPSLLKYQPQKMKLYVVIKNTILIWDILTGQLYDILQSQADQQITALDLIQNSSRFVVGDSEGSIYIRKLQNGIKISKIYKHKQKVSINHLITKRGGIWNQSVIIGCFQDGQIVVFGKDQSYDFTLFRTFNIRRNFPNVFILSVEYEQKRNILILGTNNGDIICMDVDKSRVINHLQYKNVQPIKLVIQGQVPSFLSFGKNGQIIGLYLPPHSKKFKPCCNLLFTSSKSEQKITNLVMCKLSNRCYMANQNGTIMQLLLNQNLTNNEKNSANQVRKVFQEWQINLGELIKDMILIVDETIIAVVLYMKNITLLSAQNGNIINILPSYCFSSKPNFYDIPLCFYNSSFIQNDKIDLKQKIQNRQRKQQDRQQRIAKSKTHKNSNLSNQSNATVKSEYSSTKAKDNQKQILNQSKLIVKNVQEPKAQVIEHKIFISQLQNSFPINLPNDLSKSQNEQLKIFHDPYFLPSQYSRIVNEKKKKQQKDLNKNIQNNNNLTKKSIKNEQPLKIIWNTDWKIFPQFKNIIAQNLSSIQKLQTQAQQILSTKPSKPQRSTTTDQDNKQKAQKAIQVQKKWEQIKDQMTEEGVKSKAKLVSISNFKYSAHAALEKKQYPQNRQQRDSDKKDVSFQKHKSLYKNESSPFIRLGLALQKINQKDQKAIRFIQMGERKNSQIIKSLKLPKINSRQQKQKS